MLSPSSASRVDPRKGVHVRWTYLKTHSLQVLSAARKVNQEDVDQDVSSMPGAAAPGKYPVNTITVTAILIKADQTPAQHCLIITINNLFTLIYI